MNKPGRPKHSKDDRMSRESMLRTELMTASTDRDNFKHQLASMRACLADQLYAMSEPIPR